MIKNTTLTILATVISCAAIAKDTIPSQFHGVWVPDKSMCGANPDFPYGDSGFEIKGSDISGYEEGCTLKNILSQTHTSFTGKFSCGSPDGDEVTKITLTLLPDQKTITTVGYFDGKKFLCRS